MTPNRSAPPGTIVPRLFYDDVGAAVDWLCAAFGFTELYRYGPVDDPAGAFLAVGDSSISLSKSRAGQDPSWDDVEVRPRRNGEAITHTISVRVSDVDTHFERAKRFGAHVLHEPTTYRFGERQYTAEDLAGHRWGFTESVDDVAPETWGATVNPARAE